MRLSTRLWHLVLWADQGLNVLIGSGYCDEMYSSYAHRKGGLRRKVVNTMFFWQYDHCLDAYLTELQRKQLPPEYRI